MEILVLSLLSGVGIVFTLTRAIRWRYLVKYHLVFDIAFTILLPFLFKGSFDGMVLAVLTGITVSVLLALGRAFTPAPKAPRIERYNDNQSVSYERYL